MTQDCFYAVRTGNVPLTEKLLAAGQCTVTTTRWSGVTLLHRAAGEGQTECIQLLIRHGANPAAVTHRGLDTPLHLAMGAGHESAAEALLWGGSPWHKENGAKRTPMQHAADMGFALMARRLEVSYFRIDAQRRKREQEGGASQASSGVVGKVGGYNKELVAKPGQVRAEQQRQRFKTMFAQVQDSLAARRFTKVVRRRRDDESSNDDDTSTTSMSSLSTQAPDAPGADPSMPQISDEDRQIIRANRKKEPLELRAARDKAIDAWTRDPTDDAKRELAVKAFAERMESLPGDDDFWLRPG